MEDLKTECDRVTEMNEFFDNSRNNSNEISKLISDFDNIIQMSVPMSEMAKSMYS